MKTRVLSILLLLAMLVGLVPATVVSGSETPDTELPKSETFTSVDDAYGIYVTDGLVAFFDANTMDAVDETVDFEEGKWVAKVYDKNTKTFVLSDDYFATITGGAFDATENPTGWKTDASGTGVGFDDPMFDAPDNLLSFGTALVAGEGVTILGADKAVDLLAAYSGGRYVPFEAWTVDTLTRINLRETPMQWDLYVENGGEGTYPLAVEDRGDTVVYTANRTGASVFTTGQTCPTTIVGEPGAKVTVTFICGRHPDGSQVSVTLNDEGRATISNYYYFGNKDLGGSLAVVVPAGVTVESIKLPFVIDENTASVDGGLYFGTLSGNFWTSKYAFSLSGDGYGKVRWCISDNGWAGRGGDAAWEMVVPPGSTNIWANDEGFATDNGKLVPLYVTKTSATTDAGKAVSYELLHGTSHRTGTQVPHTYGDRALQFKSIPGYVYSYRVYNRVLNELERAQNATADMMLRLGVDIELFNTMSDEAKEAFYPTAAALPETATKEEIETLIEETVEYIESLGVAKQLTEYEKLYVGYDGNGGFTAETANGAKLTSLFTAFAGDVSVNLSQGVWINKIADGNATLGNKALWDKYDDGGFGVTQIYGSYINNIFLADSAFATLGITGTRLEFDYDLLPTGDYDIEFLAQYRDIMAADENGNPVMGVFALGEETSGAGQYGYNNVTPVDFIGNLVGWSLQRDGTLQSAKSYWGENCTAIFTVLKDSYGLGGKDYWNTGNAGGFEGATSMFIKTDPFYTRNVMRTFEIARDVSDDKKDVTFTFYRDAAKYIDYTAKGYNFEKETAADRLFYLAERLSVDFYAVRIYDGPLTAAEKEQNRFADVMAYGQADLTEYNALSADDQKVIRGWLKTQPFTSDTEELQANLDSLIDSLATAPKAEDSLYVTEGLRVLTTAYKSFNTGTFRVGDEAISWFNGAMIGEAVSVKGSGWELQVDGGLKIKRSYEEWQADHNFGLYLTPEMLPESDYTVEMITNPAGITVDQPDGTVERYLDEISTWGVYNTNAFMIGPLRCINFVCDSLKPPTQAGMERRWVYRIGNRCWVQEGDADGDGPDSTTLRSTERSWMQVGVNDIINYRIVMDFTEDNASSAYAFYTNGTAGGSFVIQSAGRITNEQANNMFQLMVGMPNTVYAVRVYERLLTADEYAQNYAADILYFYDLDIELFKATMDLFPENPMLLYNLLGKMDFSLSKEEAAREFEGCLAGLWLEFKHSGIRNDKKNGMRFYFDFNQASAENVVEKGYKLEVGMLANIGSGVTPTLAGYNYDYKVVVYDSDMGKIDGFFIDEDTAALTVLAESANREALLAGINVVGYVKLIDANGEETIYYATTSALNYDLENLFTAYDHMVGLDKIKDQSELLAYYESAMAECYEEKFVYLDAAASAGGNGSKDAPYNTFPAAFADSMEKLKGINRPTRFYLQAADGEYLISDMMVMNEEDNPYTYCEFIITSENEKTRLTTARTIDTNGFQLAGENLYIYQFDADANGEYPNFRCLYVNNELALNAYRGSQFIEDFSQPRYLTEFNRYEDGPYLTAKYMNEFGTLTLDYNPYPETKVALRSRFVYYRDQFMAISAVKKMYEESRSKELDGENNRYMLGLDAECPVENPSHIYAEAFEKALLHYVACGEIFNLVAYGPVGGKRIPKSQFATQETLIEGASEAYKAKFRELAQAFAKGTSSGFNAKNYEIEVECVVTMANDALTATGARDTYALDTVFSSGMYKQAMADHKAGKLTYGSKLSCEEMHDALIWGIQYEYYRDALLALDDVTALKTAGTLALTSQPNEAGSEQYKALFTAYKYEVLAAAELLGAITSLKADSAKAAAWKVHFASVETTVADAPAEYVAIFNRLREAHVLNNYATLNEAYMPKVREADAPYGGNVPMVDPRAEAKLYLQKELVGDLSRALEDGKKQLAATAAEIIAEAKAAYEPTFERLVAAEQELIDLTKEIADLEAAIAATQDAAAKKLLKKELKALEGEKIAASLLLPVIRKAAVTAKAEYDAQLAYAAQYSDPETMDRYTLMHSGLEYQVIVEWCFDICPVWGIDYDDTITKPLLNRDSENYPTGGYSGETVEFVAVYMDRDVYEGLAICTGDHYWYPGDQSPIMGRMHWLTNLDGFMDTQGEYYYDSLAGKLYYYSKTGVNGLTFAYPQLDNMLVLNGARGVTIEKLEITGMDSLKTSEIGFAGGQAAGYKNIDCLGNETHFPSMAPIYGYMGKDITIQDCNIHDVPCEGISLHARQDNILIEGNVLTNIGSTAVRVATSPAGNTPLNDGYGTINTTITNNLVDGAGVVIRNAPSVTVACSADTKITHNTIHHSAYSAISIGWCWSPSSVSYDDPEIRTERAEIAYNYITHFMTELADGGAIYTLGGNALLSETELFNKEHDNFIVFSNITGDAEKHFYAGIYHDGASSNWETYRNVVVAQSYGAVRAENKYDNDPEMKQYLKRLRTRYSRAEFFFTQDIKGADSMNILLRDNYFVGTRATESADRTLEEARVYEAFYIRLRDQYNVRQENTRWVKNPSMMPAGAENIAYASGCEMRPGDPTTLYGNDY